MDITEAVSSENTSSFHSAFWEPLGPRMKILVSRDHRFNTDTVLLAHFSMPKKGELCADFGTGCGTIPLLWCERSAPKKAYGLEIQPEAADLSRESVRYNHLENILEIIEGDIKDRDGLRKYWEPGSLHRIACNPPYTPEGKGYVCSTEDGRLLARHQLACSFEDIAHTAAYYLRWGGYFYCCQRPEHLTSVFTALQKEGLEPKRLRFVQQRPEKAPFLFLLEASRGGKPGIRVLPTLFIEGPDGNFSPEMMEIYGSYKDSKPKEVSL